MKHSYAAVLLYLCCTMNTLPRSCFLWESDEDKEVEQMFRLEYIPDEETDESDVPLPTTIRAKKKPLLSWIGYGSLLIILSYASWHLYDLSQEK